MAQPVFTPDIQAIAKMKLSRFLPTTGDPATLAGGALGSIFGGSKSQKSGPNQNSNPLGGLLNGLQKQSLPPGERRQYI